MSIHTSLISTTLLALQQSGVFAYGRKSSLSGFYKEVQHLNSDKEDFSILVYMVSDSPTGYAIRVNALKSPEILVIDHDIESFKDFEVAIDRDYSVDILKVATTISRHQKGVRIFRHFHRQESRVCRCRSVGNHSRER